MTRIFSKPDTELAERPDASPQSVLEPPVLDPSAQAGAPARRLPTNADPTVSPARWSRSFVWQLVLTDTLCAVLGVTLGWVGWALWVGRFEPASAHAAIAYVGSSVLLTAGWLICLQTVGAYEARRISLGAREYQRILRASMNLAGSVAIIGYLSGQPLARPFVGLVIPSGAVLMLFGRFLGRRLVWRRRERGEWTSTILAVGTSDAVRHLANATGRNNHAGLVVVAACVEDAEIGAELLPGVPVVSDVNHTAELARSLGVDIVAVAGAGLGPRRIRELGWALEGSGCSMVLATGLTEVAGPRIHVSPVEGLPLMWVDQPQFSGVSRIVKRGLDIVGALAGLLVSLPIWAIAAAAVAVSSRGPIFFTQQRLGKDGEPFRMLKFRTMCVDAEQRREELLDLNECGDERHLYFKMRQDPRITPVGRWLRRMSLDEVPQLLNVLHGTMSLVGPRPLPGDLDEHQGDFLRRLRVKPGLTGLWQISGRSELSAEDAVRLDLYYVENWSTALDMTIIARTAWAVLRSRGAY
jgi:exopolysaccharide biosynthesis polyprenyl glycosylphosphotransferase